MKLGRREIAGIAIAALALVLVVVRLSCAGRGSQVDGGLDGGLADWCAPGLIPVVGDACFAAAPDPRGLIVYLHGRYAPETASEELDRQARVARMATARGFSVVAFRGVQGGCLGPELATFWCWPSNELTQDAGPATVASWQSALAGIEAGTVPRYLLGFSNGGYFATLIATRALAAFDAVAIVSGGPVEPTRALGAKPPLLLVSADDDGALDSMLLLETELQRERWPHTLIGREGGHALTDFDVDMALTFFMRTRTEKLPLTPPLSTRRPQPRQEASVAPQEDDASGPPCTEEEEE